MIIGLIMWYDTKTAEQNEAADVMINQPLLDSYSFNSF